MPVFETASARVPVAEAASRAVEASITRPVPQPRPEGAVVLVAEQRPDPAPPVSGGSSKTTGKVVQFRRRHEKTDSSYDISGFWEGTDRYVHHQIFVPTPATHRPLDAHNVVSPAHAEKRVEPATGFFNHALTDVGVEEQTPAAVATVRDRPAPALQPEAAAIPQDSALSAPADTANTGGQQQADEDRQLVQEESAASGSAALSAELAKLREKYIAGKIAGADLFDDQGELLIARHEPITPEVIDRAGRSGKLAELVVQMTIPGLDVE